MSRAGDLWYKGTGPAKDEKWNPDYTHFVEVVVDPRGVFTGQGPLVAGYEYASDARDMVKELKEDGIKAKVVAKRTAKSRGLLGLRRRWTGKCVPVRIKRAKGRVCIFRQRRK